MNGACSHAMLALMDVARISKGGQISVPATVRRRWGVQRLAVEDEGDHLILRPLPDDPVEAAMGALPIERDLAQIRKQMRAAERASEGRRSRTLQ